MQTYAQIQAQVCAWNMEQFGYQPTDRLGVCCDENGKVSVFLGHVAPLLGLVEELGELHEAVSGADFEDAVGDMMIYMCDYCGRQGVTMPHNPQVAPDDRYDPITGLVVSVGRLSHANLKRFQNIRGMDNDEAFAEAQNKAVIGFVWHMEELVRARTKTTLVAILNTVWRNVVRKRDWKANPTTGTTGRVQYTGE